MPLSISVVIPVLNEAQQIQACLQSCLAAGAREIIVVDGGSSDKTVELARQETAHVLTSPPGRGPQQNLGAAAAKGEIILFLHADCRLLPNSLTAISDTVSCDRQIVAGCFWQQIDHPAPRYRTLESGNAWRVRWLGWMYGDQGIFVRRTTFEAMGGFPDIPLMEDLAFSKRLRRFGRRVLLPARIVISPRRWERVGVVTQTLRNWLFIALWHVGVPAPTLAKWYRHIR